MKSRISVLAVGVALVAGAMAASAQTGASDARPGQETSSPDGASPRSDGPQGSSQRQPGEERYDRVAYAGFAGEGAGVFALSNLLPPDSHAEVTALDSGRTILVAIRGSGGGLIELSRAAARQLGVTGNPAVRVRRVSVTAQDAAALAAGQPAAPRTDAPPALLAGLRRQLGEAKAPPPAAAPRRAARIAPPSPARPTQAPPRRTGATVATGLFVQVAALSNLERARALADQLGGAVRSGGGLHRVQTGPHADVAAARRARADLARRGYGDARVVSVP